MSRRLPAAAFVAITALAAFATVARAGTISSVTTEYRVLPGSNDAFVQGQTPHVYHANDVGDVSFKDRNAQTPDILRADGTYVESSRFEREVPDFRYSVPLLNNANHYVLLTDFGGTLLEEAYGQAGSARLDLAALGAGGGSVGRPTVQYNDRGTVAVGQLRDGHRLGETAGLWVQQRGGAVTKIATSGNGVLFNLQASGGDQPALSFKLNHNDTLVALSDRGELIEHADGTTATLATSVISFDLNDRDEAAWSTTNKLFLRDADGVREITDADGNSIAGARQVRMNDRGDLAWTDQRTEINPDRTGVLRRSDRLWRRTDDGNLSFVSLGNLSGWADAYATVFDLQMSDSGQVAVTTLGDGGLRLVLMTTAGERLVLVEPGAVVPVGDGATLTLGRIWADLQSPHDVRIYDPAFEMIVSHEYFFAPTFLMTGDDRLYVPLGTATADQAGGLLEIRISAVPEPLSVTGGLALVGLVLMRRVRQ